MREERERRLDGACVCGDDVRQRLGSVFRNSTTLVTALQRPTLSKSKLRTATPSSPNPDLLLADLPLLLLALLLILVVPFARPSHRLRALRQLRPPIRTPVPRRATRRAFPWRREVRQRRQAAHARRTTAARRTLAGGSELRRERGGGDSSRASLGRGRATRRGRLGRRCRESSGLTTCDARTMLSRVESSLVGGGELPADILFDAVGLARCGGRRATGALRGGGSRDSGGSGREGGGDGDDGREGNGFDEGLERGRSISRGLVEGRETEDERWELWRQQPPTREGAPLCPRWAKPVGYLHQQGPPGQTAEDEPQLPEAHSSWEATQRKRQKVLEGKR